jgi:predicted transposase YdaD
MLKPFDPTTRRLIELGPADWLGYLRKSVIDPGRLSVIDSNLSTFMADADKVIRVNDPIPWIQLIELQAGRYVRLDRRSHVYSTLLEWRHQLPVRTSLVLLRPAADGPELTGNLELRHPDGDLYDTFRYDVVRVWEQPVQDILACGLTVLPLAPVSKVELADVPGVLLAISERFERETTPEQASALWSATRILMGLRYEQAQVDAIIERVHAMLFGIRGIEESTVYQGILREGLAKGEAEGLAKGLAEGRAAEAREVLSHLGLRRFGPPTAEVEARIAALDDLNRLHELRDRVLDVANWDELLASPEP